MFEYLIIAMLLLFMGWQAYRKQVPLLAPAGAGLRSGLQMCRRILPMVAGYVLAFACFRAVGGFDWLLQWLHPLLAHVGIPDGILAVLLARPFSGSLANGLFAEMAQAQVSPLLLMQTAVMLGSTETTLYVITVYFAYVGVKKSRYAIPLGLTIDLLGCWLAVTCVYVISKLSLAFL
jgi:spore maturation protein B